MIFWESDLNFVTVLLDAINLGHLLLQKPNGAGDRRVHAAIIALLMATTSVQVAGQPFVGIAKKKKKIFFDKFHSWRILTVMRSCFFKKNWLKSASVGTYLTT